MHYLLIGILFSIIFELGNSIHKYDNVYRFWKQKIIAFHLFLGLLYQTSYYYVQRIPFHCQCLNLEYTFQNDAIRVS